MTVCRVNIAATCVIVSARKYAMCIIRTCRGYHDTFSAPGLENKSIALKPIYKEIGEDEFEIVGYVEV